MMLPRRTAQSFSRYSGKYTDTVDWPETPLATADAAVQIHVMTPGRFKFIFGTIPSWASTEIKMVVVCIRREGAAERVQI